MAAALRGCKRSIAELIMSGANPTLRDKKQRTAHTYAAYNSDETREFLEKIIDVRKQEAWRRL